MDAGPVNAPAAAAGPRPGDAAGARPPLWPEWNPARVRAAVGIEVASLLLGTACAWLCLRLGFRRFQEPGWDSPAGPLALGVGAVAFLGGPGLIAWARGRRTPWLLAALAGVPLAVLFWFLVLPDVRPSL